MSAGLVLRPATTADVPMLFDVRTSVRENHMSHAELTEIGITPDSLPAMLSGDGRGWLVEDAAQVLAFAMADAAESTVFALFVRDGHEGRGIGQRLMTVAEDWLFAQGCQRLWLVTDRDPAVRANGFYRRLGWQVDGIEPDGQMRFVKHAPPAAR